MKPHYPEPPLPDRGFTKEGRSPGTHYTGKEAETHAEPLAKLETNLGLRSCANPRPDLPAWSSLQASSLGPERRRCTFLSLLLRLLPQKRCLLLLLVPAQTSPTAGFSRSRV